MRPRAYSPFYVKLRLPSRELNLEIYNKSISRAMKKGECRGAKA
jgi:hypothetical protein